MVFDDGPYQVRVRVNRTETNVACIALDANKTGQPSRAPPARKMECLVLGIHKPQCGYSDITDLHRETGVYQTPLRGLCLDQRRESCLAFLTRWRDAVRAGHQSRDTKHGLYGRSVRRACEGDAYDQKSPARTARPPPSHCFPACFGALWRGMGGALPLSRCPRSVRRSRPASRRVQNEPMLKKGNVLDCANGGTFHKALIGAILSMRLSALPIRIEAPP